MLRSISLVIILTLLLTIVLTPIVFESCRLLWPILTASKFPWPFSRVFDRVLMAALLIVIIIFRKSLSLATLRPAMKASWSDFGAGLLLSLLSAAVFVPILVQHQIINWQSPAIGEFAIKTAKFLPAAVLIALIEESFFRVLFFSALRSKLSFFTSIFITNALYAVVHFVTPFKSFVMPEFEFLAGVRYFVEVCNRLGDLRDLPAMIGLFIVGLVLTISVIRSGRIWLAVGLHCGWILVVKIIAGVSNPGSAAIVGPIGERYLLVSQPISWILIGLVGVIVLLITRTKSSSRVKLF